MIISAQHKEYLESYSNLAFNLAGFIALYFHQDISGVLVCIGFQAVGCGSFIYHWYRTKPIFLFDWWVMCLMNLIIAGYHFNSIAVWFGLLLFLAIYSYTFIGKLPVFVEVGISAVIALLAIYINRSLATFLIVAGLFGIAVLIRSFDKDPKQLIFHDSIFHSLWHVLAAIVIYLGIYLDIP